VTFTTGIPQLDEQLGGGIPEGSSLLYLNQPAVSADIFVFQSFYTAVRSGAHGLFFTNVKPPEMILADFDKAGFSLEEFGDRVEFIDAYSTLVGAPTTAKYIVPDPHTMESILTTLEQAVGDHPGAILALDSLSTMVDYVGEPAFIEGHTRLEKLLAAQGLTLACATDWNYENPETNETLRHMDGVVSLKGVQEKVIFGHYFTVEKAKWMDDQSQESILFKVAPLGGVRVYIPKIIVTGPFDAGKSTFVKTLSTRSVSVERMGTTVALDHGVVDHGGVTAEVFGTPGQRRFDPIILQLAANALGIVIIIDSTEKDDLPRAKEIIDLVQKRGLPLIIAANKQDLGQAMAKKDIRESLGLTKRTFIVPCTATDTESVRTVFQTLISQIMHPESDIE